MQEVIEDPYMIPGVSDGGAHSKFLTAGRFPTETIAKWARERTVLSLEEVHWRLSALPAWCAGFRDRGSITEGAAADIVVYDFDALGSLPDGGRRGPTGRRVAAGAAIRRLPLHASSTATSRSRTATETGAMSGALLRHGPAEQVLAAT